MARYAALARRDHRARTTRRRGHRLRPRVARAILRRLRSALRTRHQDPPRRFASADPLHRRDGRKLRLAPRAPRARTPGCRLTDNDVLQLSVFQQLRTLDLSRTPITKGALAIVDAIESLRELNLDDTKSAGGPSAASRRNWVAAQRQTPHERRTPRPRRAPSPPPCSSSRSRSASPRVATPPPSPRSSPPTPATPSGPRWSSGSPRCFSPAQDTHPRQRRPWHLCRRRAQPALPRPLDRRPPRLPPRALALGHGFLRSDLVCYAAGVLAAAMVDIAVRPKNVDVAKQN